jgi:deazaflavin-dependent oxidoreductase (nitroreductase family)
MSDMNDFNRKIVEEFRANGGKVGGQFEGFPLLLLHTTGAKSGAERINPLAFRRDEERYVVFASKAGAPTNPDWYHNVVAHPEVTVEVGGETFPARAHVAEAEERARLWEAQKGATTRASLTTRRRPLARSPWSCSSRQPDAPAGRQVKGHGRPRSHGGFGLRAGRRARLG